MNQHRVLSARTRRAMLLEMGRILALSCSSLCYTFCWTADKVSPLPYSSFFGAWPYIIFRTKLPDYGPAGLKSSHKPHCLYLELWFFSPTDKTFRTVFFSVETFVWGGVMFNA